MSKDPYKIVNAKPSWASKLASGTVALGSVATAIVITVPGLPGYEVLNQASGITGQQDQASAGLAALDSQGNSTSPSNIPGAVAIDPALQQPASGLTLSSSIPNGKSSTTLTLPGLNSGNTSSPTPYSAASASSGSATQTIGNVSSPTPYGSEDENEYEDDNDEYEDEEEEYEDDNDEYEDEEEEYEDDEEDDD